MTQTILNSNQQVLIKEINDDLDARFWHGSFNGHESSIQQLSPYVGKMKSAMASVLIKKFSLPGDIVFDPFSGSGVVPFEAALAQRQAWSNDLSPYAYVLTRGKLEAPKSGRVALLRLKNVLNEIESEKRSINLDEIPEWVRDFYHPDTLREIVTAFKILKDDDDYFLMSCLLGILHHVRPGFLSYPASHLVPYLRTNKYPPDEYPKMYLYRDVASRLIAKVERAYKRPLLPKTWTEHKFKIFQENTMNLSIKSEAVDAIISSPPYFGALDYARDNRLRLWFLGCEEWKKLDDSLTANSKVYLSQMAVCLQEMSRILKPNAYCILVLGDVDRDGKLKRTAEILADLAVETTNNQFIVHKIYDDRIPDERRSRRLTKTTKYERILVMQKTE